jgi:hypothetical protein
MTREELITSIIESALPVHPSSQRANRPGYIGPSGGPGGALRKLAPIVRKAVKAAREKKA